ncbi:Lipin/Ned1/Smp2-domain-containing protein [Bisporella sp. PMI_857]|nr:Lipin/Ned1/Smp2-domain-containing protein [Bisporella sp. PMI_857]
MQYVRSISGSVSKTWNSINPATLSGAIDVIVVEQEDGTLACSPFHVRFGKFSLLRPYEKKVEFRVNNAKQDYAMKLGEGGEAFFVFETSENIPEAMQTSPLVSPASSPPLAADGDPNVPLLAEPDFLDLDTITGKPRSGSLNRSVTGSSTKPRRPSNLNPLTPLSGSPESNRPISGEWAGVATRPDGFPRHHTDEILPSSARTHISDGTERERVARSMTPNLGHDGRSDTQTERSMSPPPLPTKEAIERALALSERLSASNIPSQVTETGDLMLDMTGWKSSDEDSLRAEVIARRILTEELEGNYDIGALIGADEHGNLWIYSSEEAKEAASQRAALAGFGNPEVLTSDAASDPGYHSDADSDMIPSSVPIVPSHRRADSAGVLGLQTPPNTPPGTAGDPNRNYAKTLRLTSDQLKALGLKPGPNPMSFTVNRATCQAYMYLWRYDVPVVISDIDGTITKSDALGHVLNMIGRDWTHIGVAKLYTEIVNNGFNIMYLTSRSVGQADTTRAYLSGVVQEGYRLPRGPTIMSPDRTVAALRRELYIRKPEVFKMACLRDIKNLFGPNRRPFYAGFGNRLTDAMSYRSVSIPSNRIFTINSNAEVSLDLLSLNKLKYSYVNMREVVDHYFPPTNTLVKGGGEEFTDFSYWREPVLEIEDFSDSESDEKEEEEEEDIEDEGDEEVNDELGESYMSRESVEYDDDYNGLEESILSGSIDEDPMTQSMLEAEESDNDEGITPGADQEEAFEGDNTQLVHSHKSQPTEDIDAEVITGVKGLGLEREETNDKRV